MYFPQFLEQLFILSLYCRIGWNILIICNCPHLSKPHPSSNSSTHELKERRKTKTHLLCFNSTLKFHASDVKLILLKIKLCLQKLTIKWGWFINAEPTSAPSFCSCYLPFWQCYCFLQHLLKQSQTKTPLRKSAFPYSFPGIPIVQTVAFNRHSSCFPLFLLKQT